MIRLLKKGKEPWSKEENVCYLKLCHWEGEPEWQTHFGSWVGAICKARISQKFASSLNFTIKMIQVITSSM